MLENNGFLGKTIVFLKAMFFDTTSHMIYFDYKAYRGLGAKTIVTTSFYIRKL